MPETLPELHAQALERFARGEAADAIELLRGALRDAFDLDVLNDLAVMLNGAGESDAARELLVALRHVDPAHEGAQENLAALAPADARTRFLQVIADAQRTHLADNLDHFFHPWGHALPDPAKDGERIAAELDVLATCGAFWRGLGDDESRELFLRFLAYRALGPAHVRLQLEPGPYRTAVQQLNAQALAQANVVGGQGMPLEWKFNAYDLTPAGYPLKVLGQPLPLASTFLFSQYAYRDATVDARPHEGDIAIDAGGCWGETALWLAHQVGALGQVHVFEPTPSNRALLAQNLALNPSHAPRVRTWEAPLAATADETLFIRDAIAAGATVSAERGERERMCELRTDTIDSIVQRGEVERVDFLKVDVEGADLGVLEGAAETIKTCRPRLAIAAYHKPDDLARIPDFVESLGVGYRWYLQCSTMTNIDTVAFAVPAE